MSYWDDYAREPPRGFIDPPAGDRDVIIDAVCEAMTIPDDEPVWRYQVLREMLAELRRFDAYEQAAGRRSSP